MPRYILQSNGERSVLHDEPLPGFSWRGEANAESWIEAKAALGFELTTAQQAMLPMTTAQRQSYLAIKRWEGIFDTRKYRWEGSAYQSTGGVKVERKDVK